MQNYHILERIGEGSFGKVYRGRRKYSGHIVALKFVSKRGKTEKNMWNLRQEINILRGLNHSNIIAMLDSFETEGEFCMVTEYAQGELFQILEDDHQLPEDEIKKIAVQLLHALHYLHTNRIIHRDMKPQNILVGPKQQIKLCDFGFARAISADTNVLTSIKGTPLYMAPELVKEQPYNHTVDLWSLGVILYELAVGRPPFYTDKIVTLIHLIVKENVKYPSTMSDEFKSFLSGLLQKDPSKRMTWPEILQHPFACETAVQLETRQALERQVRRIPSFFDKTANSHQLQRSSEWKPVDPETGQLVKSDKKVDGNEAHSALVETLKDKWSAYEQVVVSGGASEISNLLQPSTNLINDVHAIYKCDDSSCIRMTLYVTHRIVNLGAKQRDSLDALAVETIHKLREVLLQYIPDTMSKCREGVLQVVRTLMIELPSSSSTVCPEELNMISYLLREASNDNPLISKVLKWLGSTLNSASKAPTAFETISQSKLDLVSQLCTLIGSEDSSISSYAVFALASLAHPRGGYWDVDTSFPATMAINEEKSLPEKLQLLRTTYSLRLKVHTDLSNALLQVGLNALLTKLQIELQSATMNATNDTDAEDDDDEHSMMTNILKVLFYGCRVSSPMSKRSTETIKCMLSPRVLEHLNLYERYFAYELVAVCLRRSVLTPQSIPQMCSHELRRHDSKHALIHSALCSLMAEAIDVDEAGVVAVEVAEFLPLISLSMQRSSMIDQTLFCYGIRATGIIDSAVILLYRIVSSLIKHSDIELLYQVMRHFEDQNSWNDFCSLLSSGGNNGLSPWGLFCLLKLIRTLTEHMTDTDQFLPTHFDRQGTILPVLVALLRPAHIQHLLSWPDVVGGGLQAVKAMVHAIVKIISMPFTSTVISEELLFRTQEILYETGCVLLLVGILAQHAMEMELLVKFLSRLVTSSPHFAAQFVEANGLEMLKTQNLLQSSTATHLVQDALVLLSHIARSSKSHYPRIDGANIMIELRDQLLSPDAILRARTCNCAGNLSRHSNYFYDQFVQPLPPSLTSLLDGLVECIKDKDTSTRRYACFAVGNAAFHTDQLSRALRPAIPYLVQHLQDVDTKTRSNAAAALGNLVRQSATCCSDLVFHHAPSSLLDCALDETDLGTRRIALFSLGNLCEYEVCRSSLSKSDNFFLHSLEGLCEQSTDELVKKYVHRIVSKW